MIVWASKKIAQVGPNQVNLTYDAGAYRLEVFGGTESLAQGSVTLPPEVMDQLVEEWPRLRAKIAQQRPIGGEPK